MSRQTKQGGRRGPQLPLALQEQLGIPQRRQRTQVSARKQRRHEERHNGRQGGVNKRRKLDHSQDEDDEEETVPVDAVDEFDISDPEPTTARNHQKSSTERIQPVQKRFKKSDRLAESLSPSPSSTSELENNQVSSEYPEYRSDSEDSIQFPRDLSPEIVLDASSRTFLDRQQEEDDEIAALERKLGGGKKGKNVFADDDFDDLLGYVESGRRSRKAEQEWLENKRRNATAATLKGNESASEDDDLSQPTSDAELDDAEDDHFGGFDDDHEESGDDASGNDSDESAKLDHEKPVVKKPRENPYVAPPTANGANTKYVPPARRRPPESERENLDRLRKQAQGQLNKLSEANIISIVDEFQNLYLNNPRQDVTTVLLDLLLAAFAIPSTLQNTFIILHAAFIAALYKLLGADFGAEVLVKLTDAFQKWHQAQQIDAGKESLNLISLLANLFTFNVVSAKLVFEHIKLLLADFNENSAELLLRIVRDCGPQLRAEDPSSLKEIVQLMGHVSKQRIDQGKPLNIRTRVMMDTITDLKNNKMRQATNAAGATSEHLTRMRKALGSLNTRQLRGTEPLGINLDDIRNSDKKGKWWLVGASWKGNNSSQPTSQALTPSSPPPPPHISHPTTPLDNEPDYASLAQHYKMNTSLRKQLFLTIMTASDARDAYIRLTKMSLKRKQEPEIPRVLLRCCRAETVYNPYYAVVGKLMLKGDRKLKMAFSIALWKYLGGIGERDGGDDEGEGEGDTVEEVETHEIANVARMYAQLVVGGVMHLADVIKTVNVGMTGENGTLWLETLFIAILTDAKVEKGGRGGGKDSSDVIATVFAGVEARQVKSVQYFLRKHVASSELLDGDKELKKRMKRNCKVAIAVLEASGRSGLKGDDDSG